MPKQKPRRATKRIGAVLLAALPVLIVVGVFIRMSGSYKVYIVHTGSMTPTIPSKSAVLVREGEYKVGQVIAFREGGDVVTHRLVGVNGSSITTKGDGNSTADPWTLTRSDIIGGVVLAPRELGYWLMYLKNPAGLASVVVSVLCVGLVWSIAFSMDNGPQKRFKHERPGPQSKAVANVPASKPQISMSAYTLPFVWRRYASDYDELFDVVGEGDTAY